MINFINSGPTEYTVRASPLLGSEICTCNKGGDRIATVIQLRMSLTVSHQPLYCRFETELLQTVASPPAEMIDGFLSV